MSKKRVALSLLGIAAAGSITVGYAAIAVIDTQNIAQQLKTYAETAKVALQQAEQITLQAKELLALPNSVLSQYVNDFNESQDAIKSIMNTGDTLIKKTLSADQVKNIFDQKFPVVSVDKANHISVRQAERDADELISKNNIEVYAVKCKKYSDQLQEEMEQLAKLMHQNNSIEGNKQGQQLANQIAARQANIQAIQTALNILESERQLELAQANIRKKQSNENYKDAQVKANQEFISKLEIKQDKAIQNPFKKYGKVTW